MEEGVWAAVVGGGLRPIDGAHRVREGANITGSSFELQTLDLPALLETLLRTGLRTYAESSGGLDSAREEFVDFLVGQVTGASGDDMDLDSEIWLSVQELADADQQAWHDAVVRVLSSILVAMGDLAAIADPSGALRAAAGDRGDAAPAGEAGLGSGGVDNPPGRRRRVALSDARVDELVREAVGSLPPELAERFRNVAIIIEPKAPGRSLFGLYEGVPATAYARSSYRYPDRITIFKDEICERSKTQAQAEQQVRRTVLHEIGHYFGIDDTRLRELGW